MRYSRKVWTGILSAALCATSIAYAQTDWLKLRQTEFATWQSAHPNVDAQIADLKAKTAALPALPANTPADLAAAPVIQRIPGAITEIWDNPVAPQMAIIPAGRYTMGSPATEQGRIGNEGPQRRVTINAPFAVGKYPVTRDEYAAFVAETGRPDGASCFTPYSGGFTLGTGFGQTIGATWRNPGFPQTGRDPVVCVSWSDAQAYATWLSAKTGKKYRLLSEAEWEFAARAGTTTARYWGVAASRDAANYGIDPDGTATLGATGGADKWIYTSPVGSFPPNAFGLYDMVGNALQWVQDCYFASYAVPTSGAAMECATRFARGTAWVHPPSSTRTAYRNAATWVQYRSTLAGFRVARSL